MDMPETDANPMLRKAALLDEYEAVGSPSPGPMPYDPNRPTPAPTNRHQRRRYAALARAARTR